MYLLLLVFSVSAQEMESSQENTLETGFVVQGEIQRPDLTILMAKDDVTESYELQLTDSFLPKILESLERYPL
jgi:hypothetical protein